MRYLLIIFLFTATAFVNGPKLVKTKISDGITVAIPETFTPMLPDDIVQRLPSVRAPLAAYTNPDRDIDFSVNISATQWPDANLELAGKFFRSGLQNLYDQVDFINEGVVEIHGKQYLFFEIESRTNGLRANESQRAPVIKYTYIQYLVEKNRTLVFSFNCPSRVKEDWQETAIQVMKSVRVK
ncbi:hypothetical protein SanaruYs_21730 [Chryseotalea sanaruensis]|uniref:PsbP C-terminal domain-containing protein n=1 Tax=Chryseotalea sanaruensis TaxID=2482724 RepID=A0A401UAP5_9BACT|nr:hypothetical protein [Chryseotalea sanaruensis]GCC51942.1 hypothetical protein SanaruYs_21730 [Chryseotalea sanaruensis]